MLRIKQLSLAFIGLLSCFSAAEVAYAQGGGPGRGPGRGQRTRFELATLSEVQSELKLTDEQKKHASEQLTKLREKQAATRAAVANGGGGDDAAFAAIREELQKMAAELDATFGTKLDDAQKTRMNGLIAQVNGAAALMDSEIAKALELTDEQTAKLKAANDANQAALRETMQEVRDMSPEEARKAMTKMATEQTKTLMAVLTETQTKKLESLKGAELTIDMAPLRPARRQ